MDALLNCFRRGYLIFFWCRRKYKDYFEEDTVLEQKPHASQLPWLWVGAELNNGEIVTVIEELNAEIRYGDRINEDYLVDLTRIFNARRWLYLNSETLKEEEIPLEGLVIRNDPYVHRTS
jgi:hypothetical protein